MALTQKEQIGFGIAMLATVAVAFVVIWRMDQREVRLMRLATFQQCVLDAVYQTTSGGAVVNQAKYNAIATGCQLN